jgi:hypothetical protein
MTFVMLHSEFELDYPEQAEAAADYERQREQRYERIHGSLDGFRAARLFPCRGVLRIVDENESHQTIECDVCRFETTRRKNHRPTVAPRDQEF